MGVLIQDTGRGGKQTWARDDVVAGRADGIILSPFDTPPETIPYHCSARECIALVRDRGGRAFWDPSTHGAINLGSDDFSIYDRWRMFAPGSRSLSSPADINAHTARCVDVQRDLAVPVVAPTVIVGGAESPEADLAVELAEATLGRAGDALIHLVVTPDLLASGAKLDAHVSRLADMQPTGWMLSVMRAVSTYPVVPAAREIEGYCRTIYSLTFSGPVILGHADLAGLPGIAAGAS